MCEVDRLLSAGHDVSDGGLISCLLEMAFAGNRGIEVDLPFDGVGGQYNIGVSKTVHLKSLFKIILSRFFLSDGGFVLGGVGSGVGGV